MTDTTMRNGALRQMLSERRREMQDDVQGRIRVDEALFLLGAGEYGSCVECGAEISDRRLRALPFVVRCQACEDRREHEQGHARQLADRRASLPLFSDVVSS